MKSNILPIAILLAVFCFAEVNIAKAQTKEEIEELTSKDTYYGKPGKKVNSDGIKLKELPDPQKLSWKKAMKLGDKLSAYGSTYNAIKYYEAAAAKKEGNEKIYQSLADNYFLVRDYNHANKYYKLLVDMDKDKHKNVYSLYQLALTQKYLGNYEDAKASFAKFSNYSKDVKELDAVRSTVSREVEGCDLALQLQSSNGFKNYTVNLLDTNINQQFTDYAPFLKDGKTLYFGSWTSDDVTLSGKVEKYATYSRIYSANKNATGWDKAKMIEGGVNAIDFHTGNATFAPDNQTMYYTQCYQDDEQRMLCNIYRSTYTDKLGWGQGEKLDNNVNAPGFTTTHPSFGKDKFDNVVLFFASDRNKDKGMDIFAAKLNAKGSFEPAKALTINTTGDEATPFYDVFNNVLYYSSNGLPGIGGYDVFSTKAVNNEWVTPVNLGTPVNSSVDDMYFNWNDKAGIGFVVSNRAGGYGLKSETCCDDIYGVGLHKINLTVKGSVVNAETNQPVINSMVTLYDVKEEKEVKSFYAADGSYSFNLDREKEYRITARKADYEEAVQTLNTIGKTADEIWSQNISLKPLAPAAKIGDKIGIVYWDYNKDQLTPDAPDTLNQVIKIMLANPKYVLEVGSHTDSKGSAEYNLKLSQRRSDAVLRYLTSKDVDAYRMRSKAYGESEPAAANVDAQGNDNPYGRAKNRRTEFKVISTIDEAVPEPKK